MVGSGWLACTALRRPAPPTRLGASVLLPHLRTSCLPAERSAHTARDGLLQMATGILWAGAVRPVLACNASSVVELP